MSNNTSSPFPTRTIMNEKEASQYTGFSVRTMQDWRFRGVGPVYLKVGKRTVRYRLEDLDAYLNATPVVPLAV